MLETSLSLCLLLIYLSDCLFQAAKISHLPELDEEIDILSSIISKHRESEMKHSGKHHKILPQIAV